MYDRLMPVSIWPNLEKGGYDIYSHTLKKIVGWASTMDSARELANKLYDKPPYRE